MPGSRVCEVDLAVATGGGQGPSASRRASPPFPRAVGSRARPRSRMLTAALWSALAVCPQRASVQWKSDCDLRLAGSHVSAPGAGLRSMGRIHLQGQARLVVQVAFQPSPVGVQDPAVEARLLLDVPAGVFDRALGAPGHVLDVQVLQHHRMCAVSAILRLCRWAAFSRLSLLLALQLLPAGRLCGDRGWTSGACRSGPSPACDPVRAACA